jgi:hypothetical protein
MAPKRKPKPKSKPGKKTKKRELGSAGPGAKSRQIVTTDIGPSLLPNSPVDAAYDLEPKLKALARGTDALVTHVVNAAKDQARDPAEHLLDLSRAYYNEESAMGQHNVQCDRCSLKSPGMANKTAAIKVAEAVGWVVRDDYDHCPACKDGGLLLPGSSTALAVPPALTPSEMILVVRLRYILDKIGKGASLDAFLQNAERSQHRSMLSDLAQQSSYDVMPLVDKVTALIERGVDLHACFGSDTEKVWGFMRALYERLKREDGIEA